MNDEKKLKQKTILIISLVSFLVAVGLVLLLIWPLYKSVFASKDELEENKLTLEAAKKDMQEAEKYKELSKVINENKTLLDESVLKGDSVISFIEKLEETAKETGNEIDIQDYKPPKAKAGPAAAKDADADLAAKDNKAATTDNKATTTTTQPTAQPADKPAQTPAGNYFLINLEGNYNQFLQFLYRLENMSYVFKINSIETKVKQKAGVDLRDFEMPKPGQEHLLQTKIIISFTAQK